MLGACTALAAWASYVIVLLIGLTLLMPPEMGGMGMGAVGMAIVYGFAAVLAAGLLWLLILLLRLAGVPRPAPAALSGVGVSVALCVAGGMLLWLTIGPAPPPGLFLPAFPVLVAMGFALAARYAHRNRTLLVLVIAAAAVFAIGMWGVANKPALRPDRERTTAESPSVSTPAAHSYQPPVKAFDSGR